MRIGWAPPVWPRTSAKSDPIQPGRFRRCSASRECPPPEWSPRWPHAPPVETIRPNGYSAAGYSCRKRCRTRRSRPVAYVRPPLVAAAVSRRIEPLEEVRPERDPESLRLEVFGQREVDVFGRALTDRVAEPGCVPVREVGPNDLNNYFAQASEPGRGFHAGATDHERMDQPGRVRSARRPTRFSRFDGIRFQERRQDKQSLHVVSYKPLHTDPAEAATAVTRSTSRCTT